MLYYGGHSTLAKHELSQLLHLVTADAVITSRKITNDQANNLVKTLVVVVYSVCLGDIFITGREVSEVVITQGAFACTCSIDQEPWDLKKTLFITLDGTHKVGYLRMENNLFTNYKRIKCSYVTGCKESLYICKIIIIIGLIAQQGGTKKKIH